MIKYEELNKQNYQQIVNHFSWHAELSQKDKLLENLTYYCDKKKINVFDLLPLSYEIIFDDEGLETTLNEFSSLFNSISKNKQNYKRPEPSKIFSDLMHLRFSSQEPSLKKKFLKLQSNNVKCFTSNNSTLNCGKNLWLLKPTASNRGQGIKLFKNLNQLSEFLYNYALMGNSLIKNAQEAPPKFGNNRGYCFVQGSKGLQKVVLQKYIEEPYLIQQRKFDIRIWVLVTLECQLFIFKEGYIRMASEQFTLNDEKNQFVHLTNNAIQKYSKQYGNFEDGNQLSFTDFEEIVGNDGYLQIRQNMKELVVTTFLSITDKIQQSQLDDKNKEKVQFEIFGYDFFIDKELKVWLIEVNTNPCIETSSKLLSKLIPRMLSDAFKLTIDKIFHPNNSEKNEQQFQVNNFSDDENMWEQLI